jgi:hypothetical protein
MVSITKTSIARYVKNSPYYMESLDTKCKFDSAVEKQYKEYLKAYNSPIVKRMDVDIEYSKSGNATASVSGVNKDGSYFRGSGFRANSIGYSKSMELLCRILNTYAISNLLHKKSLFNMQYVNYYKNGYSLPIFTLDAEEVVKGGYTITRTANGKQFESYTILFK